MEFMQFHTQNHETIACFVILSVELHLLSTQYVRTHVLTTEGCAWHSAFFSELTKPIIEIKRKEAIRSVTLHKLNFDPLYPPLFIPFPYYSKDACYELAPT